MLYRFLRRSFVCIQPYLILITNCGSLTLQRLGKVESRLSKDWPVAVCWNFSCLFLSSLAVSWKKLFIMAAILHVTSSFSNMTVVKTDHISVSDLEISKNTIKISVKKVCFNNQSLTTTQINLTLQLCLY